MQSVHQPLIADGSMQLPVFGWFRLRTANSDQGTLISLPKSCHSQLVRVMDDRFSVYH